ncbi:MAG: hypothetical protein AAGF73_17775 [Actinomycetota bacterium]
MTHHLVSAATVALLWATTSCTGNDGATADNELDTTTWMETLFADRADTRLSSVLIPRTHDSAAVDIRTEPPCADVWVDGTDEAIVEAAAANPCRAAEIATAQDLTLDQQRRAGIRYLDLRVGVADLGAGDQLVVHHDLAAQPLDAAIAEILAVIADSRDIYVLDFQAVRIDDARHMSDFVD